MSPENRPGRWARGRFLVGQALAGMSVVLLSGLVAVLRAGWRGLPIVRSGFRWAVVRIARARRRSPAHALLVPVLSVQLSVALVFGAVLAAAGPDGADPSSPASATFAASLQPGGPFRGLATWVDMYDWSRTYSGGQPRLGPEAVDTMAARGVQVLEIQTGSPRSPGDILEPALLQEWIDRAHAKGIKVIGWYLPTLVDPALDIRRLVAISRLNVDGLGIDIESNDVANVAVRNQRLVQVSQAVRAAVRLPLQAIVLPPVLIDHLNPRFWPGFPWAQLAPFYDVWTPMGYWTVRRAVSGYRDAYRYSVDNVQWLRRSLGQPAAVVTLAGGEAANTTMVDVGALGRAAVDTGAVGAGLYDYRTTEPSAWRLLAGLRR